MRLERRSLTSEAEAAGLARSLRAVGDGAPDIATAVAETIASVRERGDAALAERGQRFDGVAADPIRVPDEELTRARAEAPSALTQALELAAANVRTVAEAQSPAEARVELDQGQRVEISEVAVGAAGIYVPGGRAPYPSSVIMGAVPARVAGVGRVAVASPPQESGLPADAILAAAGIAGVDEVYAIGGAQAIAALAYGTESVAAVDVIAGPGSPWVQEAKLQCSRAVGIDSYAGPSELLVICDSTAPPEWVALDVCAQAEHGDDGLLAVVSADEAVLGRVAAELERLAGDRPSVTDVRVTLVAAASENAAVALANRVAPEHLELACADAESMASGIVTAGCVFMGPGSATAYGDYAAGSNHVLPTGGAGRFTGPLGPASFRRRISRVTVPVEGGAALAPAVDEIARAEGFPVHGESALARRNAPSRGE